VEYLLTPPALYTAFAISSLVETYFFMMQRTSLVISRETDLAFLYKALLPPIFLSQVLVNRVVKWCALFAIAFTIHWGIAIGLIAVEIILTAKIPIPYSYFIKLFRRNAQRELAKHYSDFWQDIVNVLDEAETAMKSR
jgi:hypothetical protein